MWMNTSYHKFKTKVGINLKQCVGVYWTSDLITITITGKNMDIISTYMYVHMDIISTFIYVYIVKLEYNINGGEN